MPKEKTGTINALRFEADLLENLFDLALDLQKGRYRPSRSVCFVTRSPKLREIFAADFRDRVVHHLVVREMEKIWDPRFIHDSYASRKGKGIHGAVDRLQGFMRKVTRNEKKAGFFLQLDVRSFFMSIDKRILFSIFDQDPKTSEVLRGLLSTLIFHDPTTDYHFKGNRKLLYAIPPHKTLFKVGPHKGLPIGNLTSQFFANVYLNELDQFVKHQLRCRFYLRYVDDFILLSESRAELKEWRERISRFLDDRLALRLKEGDRIRRVSEGADFLGYITRPGYRLVRKRVVNNLKYALARTRDGMIREGEMRGRGDGVNGGGSRFRGLRVRPVVVIHLRQVLASYLGHFKHADSHRLIKSVIQKNPWLRQLFYLRKGKLKLKSAPETVFPCMREQVWFFRRHYPGFILLFKVGRYIELYGRDAKILRGQANLKLREYRRGLRHGVGFPLGMTKGMRNNLLLKGYRTALVMEGETGGRVKRRYVSELTMTVKGKGRAYK